MAPRKASNEDLIFETEEQLFEKARRRVDKEEFFRVYLSSFESFLREHRRDSRYLGIIEDSAKVGKGFLERVCKVLIGEDMVQAIEIHKDFEATLELYVGEIYDRVYNGKRKAVVRNMGSPDGKFKRGYSIKLVKDFGADHVAGNLGLL